MLCSKQFLFICAHTHFSYDKLAAGLGIEPKFSLSESDVLPLDDPAMFFRRDFYDSINGQKIEQKKKADPMVCLEKSFPVA